MSSSYGASVANRLLSPMVMRCLPPTLTTAAYLALAIGGCLRSDVPWPAQARGCGLSCASVLRGLTASCPCQVHDLKPQDRQGSWQPAMQHQTHSHGNWSDSSLMSGPASHRIATPQYNPHNSSAGPQGGFVNMHAHSSMQNLYDHQPPHMLRRNHSAGQPSWLQGGSVPVRVPSAHMDVFASTGEGVGSWGLSQSAEMLVSLVLRRGVALIARGTSGLAYVVRPIRAGLPTHLMRGSGCSDPSSEHGMLGHSNTRTHTNTHTNTHTHTLPLSLSHTHTRTGYLRWEPAVFD